MAYYIICEHGYVISETVDNKTSVTWTGDLQDATKFETYLDATFEVDFLSQYPHGLELRVVER